MSHYTVLVIGDNWEEQLDPFWELDLSREDMLKDPRAKFNDTTDNNLNDYNTKSVKKVVMPDGTLLNPWDETFKVKNEKGFNETKVPPELEQIEVPFKQLYTTFESYMKNWCGEEPDENGRYGYYYNPNAKWDWYSMGGRWSGFFKLKDGVKSIVGRPGIFNNDPKEYGEGVRADQAKKGDIDFTGMRKQYVDKQMAQYDKFHKVLNGRELPIWNNIFEKYGKEKINEARDEYWKNPVIKDLQDAEFHFDVEEFLVSREEYERISFHTAVTTYALLMNGTWYEKGQMGWWGMASNEKSQDNWNMEFSNLIDSLSDDTILTVVDCHI
jgi:hypothetical protein